MKKITVLLAMFAAVLSVFAAEYAVNCTVKTPAVKGVYVCDGEKFYPVGADGKCSFRFQSDVEAFVYILAPSDLKVTGAYSASLKPGENAVEFTLEKQAVPEKFRFIHGADIQYDFTKREAELRSDMAEIQEVADEYDCAFIDFPGDMTENGLPEQLDILKRALDSTPLRKYNIYGGHDGIKSKPARLRNFTEHIGAPYFSWNYGGIHFIAPVSEFHQLTKPEQTKQHAWMKNDLELLAPGTPVIVITHIPDYVALYLGRIFKAKGLRLLGYFGAHHHVNNVHYMDGIPFVYCGTLRWHDGGSFNKKIRIVECSAKDGILSTRSRSLNHTRRIHAVAAGNKLTALVYDSIHEPEKVTARIDGKDVAMTRVGEMVWEADLAAPLASGQIAITAAAPHTSWSKEVAVNAPAELRWIRSTGSTFQRPPMPVASGDRLYLGLGAMDVNPVGGGVLALDRNTGKKIYCVLEGQDVAGVVTDGKLLFALTNSGELYTLDAADGKVIRKQNVELPNKKSDFGVWQTASGSMQLIDGKLLLSYPHDHHAYIHCYDAATGELKWIYCLGVSASGIKFLAADGKVYFSGLSLIGALDFATGKQLWKRSDKILKGSSTVPLIDGDGVYFYLRSSVWKFDRESNKLVWSVKKRIPGSAGTIGGLIPAGNGQLFGFSTNACILLDEKTGELRKRVNLTGLGKAEGVRNHFIICTAAPKRVDGKIVVSADNGNVYGVDSETAQPGKPLLITGSAFKGAPVVVGNMYYTVAYDGRIFALEIK